MSNCSSALLSNAIGLHGDDDAHVLEWDDGHVRAGCVGRWQLQQPVLRDVRHAAGRARGAARVRRAGLRAAVRVEYRVLERRHGPLERRLGAHERVLLSGSHHHPRRRTSSRPTPRLQRRPDQPEGRARARDAVHPQLAQ